MTAFAADPLSPFSISPAALNACLGRPDSPLLLDVRRRPRFEASTRLMPGAQYCDPDRLGDFIASHEPRDVVVSCVYGHEVGQQAAATLCAAGWHARFLMGGMEGGEPGVDDAALMERLRGEPLLTIAKQAAWGVTGEAPSRWITRERPKIDRIAVPWLIQRFIDPRATFFYVPTAEVFAQAQHLQAVAYDIPGAPVSHVGELCSFDAVLAAFDLHLPALDLLATIVRGADTDRLDLAPQAAGLLAVSLGMSRRHARDDHAMLAAMLPVYDALYAWCQDKASAQDERHNWKP